MPDITTFVQEISLLNDEITKYYRGLEAEKGKSIYDDDVLKAVIMMKGEGIDYSNDLHKVDGMSGATLTAKGVNNMLIDYLNCYKNYLEKNKSNLSQNSL
jgi:Na+-transporting NADH:ubiquinone oxidoreductase subunit C